MSWDFAHPAWAVSTAIISTVAAIVSAIGTYAASKSAKQSRITAEKALKLQDRQYVFESLKVCAEKANTYANDRYGADWDTNDAANIIRCLYRAMEIIKQDCESKKIDEVIAIKRYFMNLLSIELYEEVHNGDAPDSMFQSREPTRILDDLLGKWEEVVAFFDIWGYPVATDEDLAD